MNNNSPQNIVSLSHNDLDMLGCQLCIDNALGTNKITYFNTNYRNLPDKVHEIVEFCHKNVVKLILITDVSFSMCRDDLLTLCDIGLPIIYIDHHKYPDGFFDNLPGNIKVHYSKEKCASVLTYEYLRCNNDNLKTLVEFINNFDIWKTKEKDFLIGFYLNSYFWDFSYNKSVNELMNLFKSNNYSLPKDFTSFSVAHKKKATEHIQKLANQNLIHKNKNISIIFTDDYYTDYLLELFKNPENEVLIIANSWGSIRVRINNVSNIKSSIKDDIRLELTGHKDTGHENAFTFVSKPGIDNIISTVRKTAECIQKKVNGN